MAYELLQSYKSWYLEDETASGSKLIFDTPIKMISILLRLPSRLVYFLYTLFLFTKSDIKTTVIPIVSYDPLISSDVDTDLNFETVLAAASAPLKDITHLPHTAFWIWFHVLQFDVSNQTLLPEEDENNKKDRPLPAKRISLKNAVILRWVLVPACWALSACYSIETVYASIALVALTIFYDEIGAHSGHWLLRNVVNAAGFASFEVGASLIAGAPYVFWTMLSVEWY